MAEYPKKRQKMGRVKARGLQENEFLAGAWVAASEDPVAGVDQLGKPSYLTVHCRPLEKLSESSAGVLNKYGLRPVDSLCKHFNGFFKDVQKFLKELFGVRVWADRRHRNQILSMDVSNHEEKTKTLFYDIKNFETIN